MKLEDLLKEPTKATRLDLPLPIDELIAGFQSAEKNRYGKKSPKHNLLIKLMLIGEVEFQKENEIMVTEFNNYSK